MTILCLLFVNDYLFFCKNNQESCTKLKNIIDFFCKISCQLVNFHESVLMFSRNASNPQRQFISSLFNISHSESLGKYLGCPVFQGKLTKTTFQDIINKATAKLEGQKANCLSKSGRTIFIQSHLKSLSVHTMQCFQLPKHTSIQLNKIN